MATIATQYFNEELIPAYKDNVIVLSDTYASFSGYTNFKYILKIEVYNEDGTTQTVNLKAIPNAEYKGVFNISEVIQDFCITDTFSYIGGASSASAPLHKIPLYSRNKENLKKVKLTANAEADGGAGVVELHTDLNIGGSSGYRFWNACSEHANGLTFDYTPYILDGVTKKLLTGLPNTVNRKARLTDYGTVAFFRGTFINTDWTSNTSDSDRFDITFYNSADSVISTHTIANSNANGGSSTNTNNPTEKGLLYFGAYPKNLVDGGLSIPATTSYYTVIVNNNSGTDLSLTYTFEIQENDCLGFETIRLGWVNRLGGWDYYNFTKKSTRTSAIKRNNTRTSYGEWNATTYDYGTFEGGINSYSVTATETIEANTDFIGEDEAAALEELFTSPKVVMQNSNHDFEPVAILNNTYIKQTTANDLVKQYVISLQKAHNKRIQRI